MINFPYQKNITGDYFPIINFSVYSQKKVVKTSALVDSGANISIFNPELANFLNLTVENNQLISLGGVGGRIKGYVHKLLINIGGKKLIIPVVFSHEYHISLNLIGRAGFFPNFRIIFEEQKLLLKLE